MELPALIEALSNPELYPSRPENVEVVQTHASCVFLAGNEVFKLKKPLDLGFLDYSTIARRRRMCRLEVEINRRLAPKVYLGVVRITATSNGIRLGGRGPAVDYLVHMRRLDDDNALASRLRRSLAEKSEIAAVAGRVGEFHNAAPRTPAIDAYGRMSVIRRNVDENFRQTADFIGNTIPAAAYEEIEAYTSAFLSSNGSTFLDRIEGGRIRDGHGDLRCEHVYFEPEVRIIDAIEFNKRFRYGDTAADLAFLAMDIDKHGFPDFADLLVEEYDRVSGDNPLPVLDFYRCYRAYVRAKVASFLSAETEVSDPVRTGARIEARGYAHLALRYARGGRKPALVVVSGLSGTGKSTLAAALAPAISAHLISSDEVRKQLAGRSPTERHAVPIDTELYRPEMNRRTYGSMLESAGEQLSHGRSVILDATYRRREDRLAAKELARSKNARFLVVECTADDAVIIERLNQRAADPGRVSDATVDIYLNQRRTSQPFDELDAGEHLRLDTAASLDRQVAAVIDRLE